MLPLLLMVGRPTLLRYEVSYWERGEKAFDGEEQLLVCKLGEDADVIMTGSGSSIAERTLVYLEEEEEEEAVNEARS